MPTPPGTPPESRPSLRFSSRSVVLAAVILGIGLLAMRVFSASTRVLGWLLAATLLAALLHPIVVFLSRHMPRGVAIAIVVLGLVAAVAAIVYGLVDDVANETRRLQSAAPEAAARIEKSARFGEIARQFDLTKHVTDFVNELPQHLQGGQGPTAIRSAATRFVAFLAGFVLTVFLLIDGTRIVRAGFNQVHDPDRRARLERTLTRGYQRAVRYLGARLAIALVVGGITQFVVRLADLPGPMPLALFVAVWSLVPGLGVLVGALPVVALAGVLQNGSVAVVLLGVFIAVQSLEITVCVRWINAYAVRVGPAVTVIAGMFGLELYGFGGALVAVALAAFAVAVLDEIAPTDADDLQLSKLGIDSFTS